MLCRTEAVQLPRTQLLLQRTRAGPCQSKGGLVRCQEHLQGVLYGSHLDGDTRREQHDLQAHPAE